MTNPNVARLIPLLEDRSNFPMENVMGTTTLDELELDSLGFADICIAAEEAFGIEIIDDDLSQITTVGALADLIESKLQ